MGHAPEASGAILLLPAPDLHNNRWYERTSIANAPTMTGFRHWRRKSIVAQNVVIGSLWLNCGQLPRSSIYIYIYGFSCTTRSTRVCFSHVTCPNVINFGKRYFYYNTIFRKQPFQGSLQIDVDPHLFRNCLDKKKRKKDKLLQLLAVFYILLLEQWSLLGITTDRC